MYKNNNFNTYIFQRPCISGEMEDFYEELIEDPKKDKCYFNYLYNIGEFTEKDKWKEYNKGLESAVIKRWFS